MQHDLAFAHRAYHVTGTNLVAGRDERVEVPDGSTVERRLLKSARDV